MLKRYRILRATDVLSMLIEVPQAKVKCFESVLNETARFSIVRSARAAGRTTASNAIARSVMNAPMGIACSEPVLPVKTRSVKKSMCPIVIALHCSCGWLQKDMGTRSCWQAILAGPLIGQQMEGVPD